LAFTVPRFAAKPKSGSNFAYRFIRLAVIHPEFMEEDSGSPGNVRSGPMTYAGLTAFDHDSSSSQSKIKGDKGTNKGLVTCGKGAANAQLYERPGQIRCHDKV
jgi:hypothetical protein